MNQGKAGNMLTEPLLAAAIRDLAERLKTRPAAESRRLSPAGASGAELTRPTITRSPASAPPSVRWWSHPWPDDLPGLGPRHVGPFESCVCGAWTWVRYGER